MGGVSSPAALDAVTIDGFGTLLELSDPIGELRALLPDHAPEEIERAFRAEAEHYVAHTLEARDETGLARLHADCTAVFNDALGSSLTPEQYVGALRFQVIPGVVEALGRLRASGLALAVVANWDYGLHGHLERHGLAVWFDAVVTSAEAGAKKPDPRPFLLALERLGVDGGRAVHVGDHPPHDEVGARAAGLGFEPAPLTAAAGRLL
jgi:putative hydrolase of the HAD superfamily